MKNKNGWHLLLLAQNEGTFFSISKCDKTSYWNAYTTRFKFFAVPLSPSPPLWSKGKKYGQSLPLVLFLFLLCGARWAENSQPFCHFKTLESVHMHCELGKTQKSCHIFLYSHAYWIPKSLRTRNLPFYSVTTLMNEMFCPVPTLLIINHVYKEGIMWKNRGFYHDNPSQFVSAQRGFLKM